MSSPIVITARHLLKTAPSSLYSARRSRSPSRPSVMTSPGQNGSGFAPRSTLMPGATPFSFKIFTSGVPSAAFWRIVSSYRITPLMYSAMRGARNSSSRYARRLSSVLSTPIASKRLLMVLVLSSAARMPLPGATSARATSAISGTGVRIAVLGRRHPAMGREELTQDRLALGSPNAEAPPWMVVELRLLEQLRDRDDRAGLVIGRAEHDERHACEHDRACAHRARLDGHVERAVAQSPAPERRPRRTEREHLGVGGRVVLDLAAVVAARDDRAAADDHGADRDVVVRRGRASLGQRVVHEARI